MPIDAHQCILFPLKPAFHYDTVAGRSTILPPQDKDQMMTSFCLATHETSAARGLLSSLTLAQFPSSAVYRPCAV